MNTYVLHFILFHLFFAEAERQRDGAKVVTSSPRACRSGGRSRAR